MSGQPNSKKPNRADGMLKGKRQRFVDEYLIDLNGTQAAIRAGYSRKSAKVMGSQLLTFPDVQAAIQKARSNLSKKTGLTAEYILETIQETIDRARQAIEVKDANGESTGEWKADHNAVLKGCELLGKHLGLWEAKKKSPDALTIQIDLK